MIFLIRRFLNASGDIIGKKKGLIKTINNTEDTVANIF